MRPNLIIIPTMASMLLGGCVPMSNKGCGPTFGEPSIDIRIATVVEEKLPSGTGALFVQVFRGSADREPLENVAVTLYEDLRISDVRDYVRGMRTDHTGVVFLDSLPAQTYGILFRRVGSESLRKTVEVRSGFADTLGIGLRAMPLCADAPEPAS